MASAERSANPITSRSVMKAFIATVTSVTVLIYHRLNAESADIVVVILGGKIYLKNKNPTTEPARKVAVFYMTVE